jgi:tetratricopeptide (TPR) repeat protein
MDIHPIANLIVQKGVPSANLSMFSDVQRQEILGQAADTLMRLNRYYEAIDALELAGLPLPVEQLKKIAENKILFGQYQEAYELLVKAKQTEMAEFVRQNFL